MVEKKGLKPKSITTRVSDDDLEMLNDLSESTNKTKSDTIIRAYKFWRSTVDISKLGKDDEEEWGKVRKNNRIRARMDEDVYNSMDSTSRETGLSIGQIIRRSIREYESSLKTRY